METAEFVAVLLLYRATHTKRSTCWQNVPTEFHKYVQWLVKSDQHFRSRLSSYEVDLNAQWFHQRAKKKPLFKHELSSARLRLKRTNLR